MSSPLTDVHIILVLDNSGSMGSIREDMRKAVNTMFNEQKQLQIENDHTTMTYIRFGSEVEVMFERKLLTEVQELTPSDYPADGSSTALYDAVGTALTKYRNDDTVVVFVVTDGGENSSRDFTFNQIKELMDERKEAGWKFIFLSSEISSTQTATNWGITGSSNIAIGSAALAAHTTGTSNVAIGHYRLTGKFDVQQTTTSMFPNESNTIGASNVAIGQNSFDNTTSSSNSNSTGSSNVAIGSNASHMGSDYSNSIGASNVAIGFNVGYYTAIR